MNFSTIFQIEKISFSARRIGGDGRRGGRWRCRGEIDVVKPTHAGQTLSLFFFQLRGRRKKMGANDTHCIFEFVTTGIGCGGGGLIRERGLQRTPFGYPPKRGLTKVYSLRFEGSNNNITKVKPLLSPSFLFWSFVSSLLLLPFLSAERRFAVIYFLFCYISFWRVWIPLGKEAKQIQSNRGSSISSPLKYNIISTWLVRQMPSTYSLYHIWCVCAC